MSRSLIGDPFAAHVVSRLLDFFADTTPWPRRLWQLSTVLALREAHELGRWVEHQVISAGALDWYRRVLEQQLGSDHGIREQKLHRLLNSLLRSGLRADSAERRQLGLRPLHSSGPAWTGSCTPNSSPA